ncbi:hypothetical protein DYB37_006861 [Aphanomyces astaci]|uniref:Peptidase M24 domain-containing protein n=1 Tax=Aphanomyces astaci TaxID=112090 RepID=A0A3R7C9A8_APHAT|nr:hypothetical protein DYB35_006339 [Aphanomyces astaci]RHZ19138.1 hypothetical protein DYB37_006861 [Aphanomyces astaci]
MSPTLDKLRRAFAGLAPRVLDAELRIQSSSSVARVSALLVESEDAHGSEYVSSRDMRRTFVSGFDGSAGTALITHDHAYLWTDGRYFLQAEHQLSKDWTLMRQGQKDVPTVEEWVEANLHAGDALAIDPLLTSVATARRLVTSASKSNASVVCCEWGANVVDQVWADAQPARVPSDLQVLGEQFTGASVATKLSNVLDLAKKHATAIVLTALDDIAWLFNIRGSDVEFNPVVMAYALVTVTSATLFVDAQALTPDVLAHFGSHIEAYAASVPKDTASILVDPAQCNVAVFSAIPPALRKEAPSIVLRHKAIKNPVEIQGMKDAHIRDGAAQVRFFHWLQEAVTSGQVVTEVSADKKQQQFRRQMDHFKSLSFATISGSGPNGAIIHYHVNADDEATCGRVTTDQMYLNDSGAQYLDGTTDVTRTVHLGQPTAHEVHCFTHVLKAHIALATAVFPNECEGVKLDAITRAPLWKVGLDYRHGTGHGVGAFLNVHEKGVSAYGKFCTFETITLIPIQRKLIDVTELTAHEIAWVDTYHADVRAKLSPLLEGGALAYLERETRPLVQ